MSTTAEQVANLPRRLAVDDAKLRAAFMEHLRQAGAQPEIAADGFTVCWFERADAPMLDATFAWPPTLASVIAENYGELEDDLEVIGGADGIGADRSKDIVFADRLFKRLAEAEAHVVTLDEARRLEIEHITTRYAASIQTGTKRIGYLRFLLEGIARMLFPDAKAKSKSLNLPYGTLGRKDFKRAPELVDEDTAVAYAMVLDRSKVKVTITCSLEELEDRLATLVKRAEKGNGTITEAVRKWLDDLFAPPAAALMADTTLKAKRELNWGALKKEPAVDLYTMARADCGIQETHAAPVQWREPMTVFTVAVTEAK